MLAMPDPSTFEMIPWADGGSTGRMFCNIMSPDGHAVRRRPASRAQAQPPRRPGRGVRLLRRPRDGVLLLRRRRPIGRPDAARSRFVLRPHHQRRRLRPATPDALGARSDGHPGRVLVPRGLTVTTRDRSSLHRRAHDGRPDHDVPTGRARAGHGAESLRQLHAETARWDPGFGHAPPPVALRRGRATPSTIPTPSTVWARSVGSSPPASCITHERSRRSPTNSSTPTNDWSSATKPRCGSAGLRTIARPWSGCRSPRPTNRARPESNIRSPDPACNPYLAFSVILAAGMSGIRQGLELPKETTAESLRAHAERRTCARGRNRSRPRWPRPSM